MKLDLQKYCEISTIHGLVYVTRRFHLAERIFWTIALFFSGLFTLILIFKLIVKLLDVPIVIYLDDQAVQVADINFPAITVCPHLSPVIGKYHDGRYFKFDKHLEDAYFYENEEFLEEFEDEMQLSQGNYSEILDRIDSGDLKVQLLGIKLLKRLHALDLLTNRGTFLKFNYTVPTDDVYEVLGTFQSEFTRLDYAIDYVWNSLNNQLVSKIITQWGICNTFNMAVVDDVLNTNGTSDDFHYEIYKAPDVGGQSENATSIVVPRRVSSSKVGLEIPLKFPMISNCMNLLTDCLEKIFIDNFEGNIFVIHKPHELPTKNAKPFILEAGRHTDVIIEPTLYSIDDSLADYHPFDRNCYLDHEKSLKFFKIYTKNNCENECLTEYMISRCGCVEFFMIRNSTTRICSGSERNCFEAANNEFWNEYATNCECLQLCNHISYRIETVQRGFMSSWNARRHYHRLNGYFNFKSSTFNQLIRKKQFSVLDFLSLVGGILGLFAGFSALSFVELIYWFTVRFFIGNMKKTDDRVYPMYENSETRNKNNFFKHYFGKSSIHGLKHIFEFSAVDSIIWAFIFILSITWCFFLISSVREKLPDSRVIAYDDSLSFNEEIPFPAFTIVSELSVPWDSYSESGSYFKRRINSSELQFNETMMDEFYRNLTRCSFCNKPFQIQIDDRIVYLHPYIFDVFRHESRVDWLREQYSSFNGRYLPEYAEILTRNGMGFTFNLLDADQLFNLEELSKELHYTRNITTQKENFLETPKTLLTANRHSKSDFSMTMSLKPRYNGAFISCLQMTFLIHDPHFSPSFTLDTLYFDWGFTLNALVTPEVIRTDEDLRNLHPKVRECYFDGEKSLKFFKKYSQKNCEIECFAHFTMETCGCVDRSQPFKSVKDLCLHEYYFWDKKYCPRQAIAKLLANENFSIENNCSCLPSCNSVTYNIKYYPESKSINFRADTIVNIKMNMDDMILYRRHQQFTFTSVVSYVGGLLGLFAGISVLSIVEFAYFFTIRIVVNVWGPIKRNIA